MKKIYLSLMLVAFTSLLFVNCESDDGSEVIEEIEVITPVNPIDLERGYGGADAVNILTEAVYTSLTIELAYVEGDRPKQSSLDSLTAFINKRAYKSGGITYVETVLPSDALSSIAPLQDGFLDTFEEAYRTEFRSDTNLALWVLMVNEVMLNEDGTVDDSTLAYVDSNTRMLMHIPNLVITGDVSPISGYDGVESSTLQHEFCHWLSLVDDPADDPVHGPGEHSDNEGHCIVNTCLMFASSNNPLQGGYVSRMESGFLVELDALCIADLQALGGK